MYVLNGFNMGKNIFKESKMIYDMRFLIYRKLLVMKFDTFVLCKVNFYHISLRSVQYLYKRPKQSRYFYKLSFTFSSGIYNNVHHNGNLW